MEVELKVGSLANKNYFKKFQEIIIFDVYASTADLSFSVLTKNFFENFFKSPLLIVSLLKSR